MPSSETMVLLSSSGGGAAAGDGDVSLMSTNGVDGEDLLLFTCLLLPGQGNENFLSVAVFSCISI